MERLTWTGTCFQGPNNLGSVPCQGTAIESPILRGLNCHTNCTMYYSHHLISNIQQFLCDVICIVIYSVTSLFRKLPCLCVLWWIIINWVSSIMCTDTLNMVMMIKMKRCRWKEMTCWLKIFHYMALIEHALWLAAEQARFSCNDQALWKFSWLNSSLGLWGCKHRSVRDSYMFHVLSNPLHAPITWPTLANDNLIC